VSLNRSTDAVAGWRSDQGVVDQATHNAGPRKDASPAVHAIELRKDFHGTIALRGLSMTVGRGEVFGFLGPNGAGKTTAVKLLLGLIRPSSGEAMVLGAPAGDRETRRRIGYLPELFRYQSWLSAREVLTLHCQLLDLPRQQFPGSIGACLETVGLSDRGNDKVGTFSKGMQQRLGLGVALLGQPELVILDEPTSALDPLGRHDVRDVIRSLRAAGTTVFLNTHLLEEAEQVCDRVCVIDHGRSIATGTLAELVGRASSVRLKIGGLDQGWWRDFSDFGHWTADGEWLSVEHVASRRIPELVDAIVAIGGRVEAVVPEHRTLEERFIELLRTS
jgi:ABC-2 type transport system ATP-binding protein